MALRLRSNLKRTTLAQRAGVSGPSLKRFEDSGEVSFKNLLRLAHALGHLQEFEGLLEPPKASTMEELEAGASTTVRKRGRL